MNIKKEGDFYLVESSKKGKFYKVDIHMPFCECPAFIFRMKQQNAECKHIIAVHEFIAKHGSDDKKEDKYSEILDYVMANQPIESILTLKKFGEEDINELIRRGELIEDRGMIKIL